MSLRKSLAVALVTGLLAAAPVASAAEPTNKPTYGFSSLKAVAAADAKAKAEAWLKAAGKYDAAAVEAVWKDDSKAVLDRVAETFRLGSPAAAAVLDSAKSTDPIAEVPAVLKDAKQDPFFRANLAVVFAKANAGKKGYEEALEALAGVAPELVVEPAGFFFYKAVAEHATMKRDAATATITRLLDDVADAPDRYKMVATLMFFDMLSWSPDPKDMSNIERLMDNSGRRLDLARPGEKTQDIQKKIVFRLDEIIKELENQCKGCCNGGNCPGGGVKPGSGSNRSSSPAPDSQLMGGAGAGKVDEKKLRQVAETWGTLPADKRAAVVEEITRGLPPKYEKMVNDYFKSLNKMHGFSDK